MQRMRIKRPLMIISLILSALSLFVGQSVSRVGFPISFMFYKGGQADKLRHAYEVLTWTNLKQTSTRIDLFLLNTLLIYVVLFLATKIILKITDK